MLCLHVFTYSYAALVVVVSWRSVCTKYTFVTWPVHPYLFRTRLCTYGSIYKKHLVTRTGHYNGRITHISADQTCNNPTELATLQGRALHSEKGLKRKSRALSVAEACNVQQRCSCYNPTSHIQAKSLDMFDPTRDITACMAGMRRS